MEWVETTGRTVEEAKEKALDQLGVHEEDAEFEVVEEPKAGLFGRVRGEARVRARVRPTQVRQKIERRDRKRNGNKHTVAHDQSHDQLIFFVTISPCIALMHTHWQTGGAQPPATMICR